VNGMDTSMSTLVRPSRDILVASAGLIPARNMRDAFGLNIVPGMGGSMARGIHANGDKITQTADNVDLNAIWNEFQTTLGLWNSQRDALVRFLTYGVTVSHEFVYQAGATANFEDATEYGEPVGYRPEASSANMGYTFKWKDLAFRYTWQYLADALASQVESDHAMALEADSRETFIQVMETLFGNARRTNKEGVTVFPFYNGQSVDSFDTPPTYRSTSFDAGHNHFLTTGAAALGQEDVEALEDTITEHGYTKRNGNTLILLVNRAESNVMRNWRSTANGGPGRYDFIPAQGTPAFLMPLDPRVVTTGSQPAAMYNGFDVVGSYGEFLVILEDYIPAGYLVGFATGGQDSLPNPIAFREHANAGLRGLRLVKGRQPDYPLVDSFYNRGFGTGVRHRGAAAILKVTAGAYSPPNFRA
jgi:hypothetical protein